jgi:hypothetical protein
MPVTSVKSRWVDGNLVFYDKDVAKIIEIDGNNRAVDISSGSKLKLAGTQLSATAAKLNAAVTYVDSLTPAAADLNAGYALVGGMTGGSANADHLDTAAAVEVLAANGAGDGNRALLIIVKCTETLAATTNLPVFQLGDGTDVAAFATIGHGGNPATLSENDISVFSGVLTEARPVEITVTDGTGGSEAGSIQVFVIALPVTST